MGMPVLVEIVDTVKPEVFHELFDYFHYVDNTFSTYKDTSEISKINSHRLKKYKYSADVKKIFRLSEVTKRETDGYFNIQKGGIIDPSGIVKGWAIHNAARMLKKMGLKNYYIEIAGDIEVSGVNRHGNPWRIGIRNPFNGKEIIKAVILKNKGIATSGTYERGTHIYNPSNGNTAADDISSLTVIGPDVYEADRFATAAFAMGKQGIRFIERLKGFEGYMIDKDGIATMTSKFETYSI